MRNLILIAFSVILYTGAQAQEKEEYFHIGTTNGINITVDNVDDLKGNARLRILLDTHFVKELDMDAYWSMIKFQILNILMGSDFGIDDDGEKRSIVPLPSKFNELRFEFNTSNDSKIAWAKSPGDSDYVINIDPQKWTKLNARQRMWTLHHEVMHEIQGVEHGYYGELMFPVIPNLDDESTTQECFTMSGNRVCWGKSDDRLADAIIKAWTSLADRSIKNGEIIFKY